MMRFALLALAGLTQTVMAWAGAPTNAPLSEPTTYRLSVASTFQEGCFDPCLCPLMNEAPLLGTCVLTPLSITGFIDTYQVSQVNWVVPFGGEPLRITGGGVYEIGGEVAIMSRLQLDLTVGDDEPAHFDSGWIVGPAGLDHIDVTISINGIFCYDTVIHLDSAPISERELTPYVVLPVSSFQIGCFGFCDCLLGPEQAMRGRFDLMPLGELNGFHHFAVLNFRSHVAATGAPSYPAHAIRGFGIYQMSADHLSDPRLQALLLSLLIDGAALTEFSSGLVPGGEAFPAIDTQVSIDGLICFDTAITLNCVTAKP